jgi:hypothetical protein
LPSIGAPPTGAATCSRRRPMTDEMEDDRGILSVGTTVSIAPSPN